MQAFGGIFADECLGIRSLKDVPRQSASLPDVLKQASSVGLVTYVGDFLG